MTLTEAIPKKLAKEEIIKLTLDYQDNFDQDLKSIEKGIFFRNSKLNFLSPSKSGTFCMTKWYRLREIGVISTAPDMNV